MGGFSEISIIVPPPHVVTGRLWANNGFAGILNHFNGLEKKEIFFNEDLHHTFDPVASGFDPSKDTVIDPVRATLANTASQSSGVDPATTTGETT